MRLICLGLGYCAEEFVRRHRGDFSAIAATCRTPAGAEAARAAGVTPIPPEADERAFAKALRAADVLLFSAAPDERGDPFLPRVRDHLGPEARGKHVLYLSTVGVYGDHDGAWVDETTPVRPVSRRSLWRVRAEQDWLAFGREAGASVQVFRLAGIYGPGQNALENLLAGTARRLVKPGQVFNRIHVGDIAAALRGGLARGQAGAIWNVTDNEPAPPQDVVSYAAELLNMPPPPEVPFDPARLTPMAASFYGENKRVSNRALRDRLGVQLAYPSYREGLTGLLATLRR